jgi:uncharacterized membrane protein
MTEHERTFTVHVSAEEAFQYLSSVDHLPDFVPYLRSLREEEDDHVFGVLDFGEGRRGEASGFFRAYPAERRLDWESDGTPGYRGWLRIEPEGADRARITAHISMPGGAAEVPPRDAGLAGDRVERAFDSVVRAIQETLEHTIVPTRSAI